MRRAVKHVQLDNHHWFNIKIQS